MTTLPDPAASMRTPPQPDAPTVVLRADATASIGVGHVMRLLALAQELISRGIRVELAGGVEIPWVAQTCEACGIVLTDRPDDPASFAEVVHRRGVRAVVLDGYDIDPAWGRALRDAGVRCAAMIDGEFAAAQVADLYIDQNPGARPREVTPPAQAVAGARYTLFRDDVLAHRRPQGPTHPREADRRARVLCVFGGTDPMGAAPVVVPLLLATAEPIDITVVSPDPTWARDIRPAPDQTLTVIDPVTDLAARAARSDLVVTASGSSVWELLCLGAPIAVVCVIDNQRPGYDLVLTEGLGAGLGELEDLREDEAARAAAVATLRQAMTDDDLRATRVRAGQTMLDGRGRARVADALLPAE